MPPDNQGEGPPSSGACGTRCYLKELSFLVCSVCSVSTGRTVDHELMCLLLTRGVRFQCDGQALPVTKLSNLGRTALLQSKWLLFLQNCFETCGFLYWTVLISPAKKKTWCKVYLIGAAWIETIFCFSVFQFQVAFSLLIPRVGQATLFSKWIKSSWRDICITCRCGLKSSIVNCLSPNHLSWYFKNWFLTLPPISWELNVHKPLKFLIILLLYLSRNYFVRDRVICKSEPWTIFAIPCILPGMDVYS